MSATLETLLSIDDRLAAAGHHRLTPFWREQLERLYTHPTARTLVGCVGRGGAKSHTSSKVALNETLFGSWSIPPGERHYWAFVSKSKEEAAQRLTLLQSFLRALGVPFDVAGDEIALRDMPRGFRVFACQIGAVSGFRCYGYSADECAKYIVAGVHTAEEIVTSLNAMTITHPGARRLLISSPTSTGTLHAERFRQGDTAAQIVAHAPSWVANPAAITEAQTRAAEPHEQMWAREYAAIAIDGIEDNWFGETALQMAIDPDPSQPIARDVFYRVACDPAFAHDRFGWAVVSSLLERMPGVDQHDPNPSRHRVTRVVAAGAWKPDRSPRDMALRLLTEVCRPYHTKQTLSDQYHGESWRELARDIGLHVRVTPWVGGDADDSKTERFKKVRLAMLQGAFRMPNDPDLLREFRSVRGILSQAGNERIIIPRSSLGHGDRVSAVVLAASEAMMHRAQLPPSMRTWLEENQMDANEQRLITALGGKA